MTDQSLGTRGWHRGGWMQTFTGRQFFPMDPRPEEVDPTDIAHALSLLCRYNGHVDRFYSVAEHCVHLSYVVPPEHALWALLHDATEAYVGDMISPLKIHMPGYRAAEDRAAKHGHGEGVGHDSAEKVALDELHKRKIDIADRVLVLNVGGYIGESTRGEIEYAEQIGRPIDYLFRPDTERTDQ
jgi:hypothetical protein